eukprot:Phypoly_transcript_15951.p1 GENE.Phypoly_transcript_15951~~Phypoly_transcript_15951.p1  ORF type:complete len:162 (+),score=20.22 Phypoly_transcript_15951:263-748(+)
MDLSTSTWTNPKVIVLLCTIPIAIFAARKLWWSPRVVRPTIRTMPTLPSNVHNYKSTKEFDELSVPEGLKKRHKTMKDVWAQIVVLEGQLQYVIEEEPVGQFLLTPTKPGVIEPQVPHHVALEKGCRFRVDFYKAQDSTTQSTAIPTTATRDKTAFLDKQA